MVKSLRSLYYPYIWVFLTNETYDIIKPIDKLLKEKNSYPRFGVKDKKVMAYLNKYDP